MAERLRDDAVADRLTRLEELLADLEQIPGPAGEVAVQAVAALADVYGEALARATGYAAEVPGLLDEFVGDELLGHLLVLHDIHPESLHQRVIHALGKLKPAVAERGGEVELTGIDQGVATVMLSIGGCGSSASGVRDAVREAVLAIAPELSDVRMLSAREHDPAFIPLEALTLGPGARP